MSETDSFLRFFINCKRRFRTWNTDKIQKYQLEKGKELVKYVKDYSKFFASYYHEFNSDDVWNLPTINKEIMMNNFNDYNTIGLNKKEILSFLERIEFEKNYGERFRGFNIAMSSGTSGNKGIVLTSPAEEKYLQAAFFARFNFPKTLRIKWAFILRITTPAFQVKKFGQQLTHFDLNLPLNEMREKLNQFKPNILSAPPSMLKLLAEEKRNDRLLIKPKRIVSYAEVLQPEIKDEIEEAFRTTVHQIYQGSEGSIALTCKKGLLHVNEDLVNLQLYNKDGTKTEPGQPCYQLVITDLHKKSQPVIRYELNDVLVISQNKCSCGSNFRVIEQIMGRADDIFIGRIKTTNEIQYIFPDFIRRAIISSTELIIEYQVIQKSIDKIVIRVLIKNKGDKQEISQKLERSIARVFKERKCEIPSLNVLFEKPLRNEISEKMIRIKREFILK